MFFTVFMFSLTLRPQLTIREALVRFEAGGKRGFGALYLA